MAALKKGRREAQSEANNIIGKLQAQVEQLQNDSRSLHTEKDKLWQQLVETREQIARLEKINTSSPELNPPRN